MLLVKVFSGWGLLLQGGPFKGNPDQQPNSWQVKVAGEGLTPNQEQAWAEH